MKLILLAAIAVCLFPLGASAMSEEKILTELSWCESQFRPEIKIVDSNGKYSYGMLMYQLDTFYSFGKLYGILPPEMTKDEARLLINNSYIQRGIWKEMHADGLGDDHWVICYKKISRGEVKVPSLTKWNKIWN